MIWMGFIVGVVGSLHCVGMCGPFALALPFHAKNKWRTLGQILLYHLGRIVTYATLGVAIGFLGQTIVMAGIQIYLSISLGLLLILAALFSINLETRLLSFGPIRKLNSWVQERMTFMLRSHKRKTLFGLGILNGLLPCGLVYLGIMGAISTGNALEGAAYMGLFGMGTLPLLLLTGLFGQFIPLRWRRQIRGWIPVFLVGFALLILYRGIQFEIPDSVRFWEISQTTPSCH